MSRSTISTFELFAMFPDAASARCASSSSRRRVVALLRARADSARAVADALEAGP